MVNQDPEPKILTAQADFAVGTVAGCPANSVAANTGITTTLFTNQANNEQCTFYGFAVDVVPLDVNGNQVKPATLTNPYYYNAALGCGSLTGTFTDFLVQVMVGGNSIPTNTIEVQRLLVPGEEPQRFISFSTPVLVLYQQPLQIQVNNQSIINAHVMGAAAVEVRTVRVKITLFGENEIQKTIYA